MLNIQNVHCFTSISFSYLNRARVLGRSLRRLHPDWKLWCLLTDEIPPGFEFNPDSEPFDEFVYAKDLGIENFQSWLFKHDLVEACTAVKGKFLVQLLEAGAGKVVYLDPDIAVINELSGVTHLLDSCSVVLTPHQLTPDLDHQGIVDNEIGSLAHGTYNLGFIAVANTESGLAFAHWWSARCLQFCFDEKNLGLFVDQKWCDLAPALFDGVHILRDPGYNVASWNLSNRNLRRNERGQILINEHFPLRFYHFTKLGPVGDAMTRRYADSNIEVFSLWAWYRCQVEEATEGAIPQRWWAYGTYSDGSGISSLARRVYRSRIDLQKAFPNPFNTTGDGYSKWLSGQGKIEYSGHDFS